MRYEKSKLIELERRLERFPRLRLVSMRTPVDECATLGSELEGPRLFVKRDDLTGLAFGGNKVRQMEFFVGDALAQGADTFIAGGNYAQSNHARVAAAAAKVAQLRSVILQRPGEGPVSDSRSGNGLLTEMFADDCMQVPELEEVDRSERLREVRERAVVFDRVADQYRERGYSPYSLVGSSTGLGVMGYVRATCEIVRQSSEMGLDFSHVVVTSMGVTQAGLLVGREAIGADFEVVGMANRPIAGDPVDSIVSLAEEAAEMLEYDSSMSEFDFRTEVDTRFAGQGYGVPTPEARRATELLARTEGLLLDPVYTSKGFSGLVGWIESGRLGPDDTVLFIHTGGLPSLFSWPGTESAPERSA